MVLDTLEHPGINVKNLVTETPEKKPERDYFDPNLDLKEEDWQNFAKVFENVDLLNDLTAARLLFKSATISRERTRNFFPISKFEHFASELSEKSNQESNNLLFDYRNLASIAALAVTYPEKKSLLNIQDVNVDDFFQIFFINSDPGPTWEDIAFFRTLFPNFKPPFKTGTIENAKRHIETEDSIVAFFNGSMVRFGFWDILKDVQISQASKDQIKIRDEIVNGFPDHQKEYNIGVSFGLAVMSVKEIKISEAGVELIYPGQESELIRDTQPLPERKNY